MYARFQDKPFRKVEVWNSFSSKNFNTLKVCAKWRLLEFTLWRRRKNHLDCGLINMSGMDGWVHPCVFPPFHVFLSLEFFMEQSVWMLNWNWGRSCFEFLIGWRLRGLESMIGQKTQIFRRTMNNATTTLSSIGFIWTPTMFLMQPWNNHRENISLQIGKQYILNSSVFPSF